VLAGPVGGLMTSTISEPALRRAARDGRRRPPGADSHRADSHGADSHGADSHGADSHGADSHGADSPARLPIPSALRRAALRAEERRRPKVPAGDKTAVPRPSVPLLPRPRVTELIERASAKHRVTLVCGPSGAGKTIACAAWAASAPAADCVGWLSLDYGDRWARQLWSNLKTALAGIPALPAEIADDLPDPADDAFPLHLARLTVRLATPVTLVLDDVSELAGAAVLAGVDQLIRHAPPTLRLVLAGRHAAGLQVARLRVGGELAEIGPADLACTPDEAREYFRMLGHALPDAERDELLRRTQGWMTGLRLAAMRVSPGRPAASVSRITGAEPTVADYLWDEVLACLPAERRIFMMRTSVADVICGDLADALGGGSEGSVVLDQLSRENMMVGRCLGADAVRAGPGGAEYRYHPMLLDFLRERLRRELPGEAGRLTRRAARWLAARGRPAEAIRTAARAGDWDFAGRVLAEAGPAMLVPGPAAELEPVLATFPASRFASDAAVAGALAAAGLRTGDTCAAALHLDNAEQALGQCPPAQRQRITTWLQALRLMTAADEPAAAGSLVERSLAIAAEAERTASGTADHQGLGLLWCALGVARLADLEIETALGSFARARKYLRDGRPELVGRAQAWQALAEAVYGDLPAAGDLAPDGDDDPVMATLTALTAAYVHLAKDEPAAARGALDRCESAGRLAAAGAGRPAAAKPGDPLAARVIGALASAARTRLALADGDVSAARGFVNRLRYQLLSSTNQVPGGTRGVAPRGSGGTRAMSPRGLGGTRAVSPDGAGDGRPAGSVAIDRLLAPLEAEIALRDGDHNRAWLALAHAAKAANAGCAALPRAEKPGAAAGAQDAPHALDATADGGLLLARARVHLAQGDNHGALAVIRPFLDPAADGSCQVTLYDRVCALVAAAVAARRLGQTEVAADQLTSALSLAEPGGMYRPFLDGGAAARSALTVLIRPVSHTAAFAARTLQRFELAPATPGRGPGQPASSPVPLTSSELAVLRFLPSHMTNQEIAEALFLSINTVKTHLRSVYRKLAVTTRRQAIARAGKLGLL